MTAGVASMPSPAAMQLAQIDSAIATASQTLGPNHPDLQNMRNQRAAVAAAAARERAASRPASISTGPSIGAMYSAQQAKVLAQRGLVNEAQRLGADVAILRDQFNKTAARAAELSQEAESTEAGLTLLGSAVAPQTAAFPKMPLVIFGSLGFGLALGLLISLIVELLSRRVRGAEDLQISGVPVIGVMGHDDESSTKRGLLYWLGFGPLVRNRANA